MVGTVHLPYVLMELVLGKGSHSDENLHYRFCFERKDWNLILMQMHSGFNLSMPAVRGSVPDLWCFDAYWSTRILITGTYRVPTVASFRRTIHQSSKIGSHAEVAKTETSRFFLMFLLVDRRFRVRNKRTLGRPFQCVSTFRYGTVRR